MNPVKLKLSNENDTVELGKKLAEIVGQLKCSRLIAFLNGDLGAGKTTMTRGFVHGFGFEGNVKSPTYTLVEPYEKEHFSVYHFDLYRLADPEELEFLGIRDYFSKTSYCMIEWPEKAQGYLPQEDLVINMVYDGEAREAEVIAHSDIGMQIVEQLKKESC